MAPISPGRPVSLPRKVKKQTTTTNKHRYESFTKRISRLKIDPVHAVGRTPVTNNDTDLTQSHFRTSLEEWAELNLTQTFTSFLTKVNPLSENLPQLVHHADAIFDLFISHIEKQDVLSLEPLLSLLAHFAHDLGQKYEKYFARTVSSVAQVASLQENPEVIESCFTCLAWMFKYLSRLLVHDLRPLLDIMIPYLGAKKEYVVRFSAESLAFLLRKAAIMYSKKKAPLRIALDHLLQQFHVSQRVPDMYKTGLMTLIGDTAMGVEPNLHGTAPHLVGCLLDLVLQRPDAVEAEEDVLDGVVINIIHRTDAQGLEPVIELFNQRARHAAVTSDTKQVRLLFRMIRTLVGTDAKIAGSKVVNWSDTISSFVELLSLTKETTMEPEMQQDALTTSVFFFQYAPMNELLPYSNKFLDLVGTRSRSTDFLAFCYILAERNRQRFVDLLLPRLQQFIGSHWRSDELGIALLLQDLHAASAISQHAGRSGYVGCPPEWESSIISKLYKVTQDEPTLPPTTLGAYLHLGESIQFPKSSQNVDQLRTLLHDMVKDTLAVPNAPMGLTRKLILGYGFKLYLALCNDIDQLDSDIWGAIAAVEVQHYRLVAFLKACCMFAERSPPGTLVEPSLIDNMQSRLIDNLLYSSFDLRGASIQLLVHLCSPTQKPWLSEMVEVAEQILRIRYNPQNAREIAMLVRRLPPLQRDVAPDSVFRRAIPVFCLGLLPGYHDRMRGEVCSVLAQMIPNAEDILLDVVAKWLQSPGPIADEPTTKAEDDPKTKRTAFEDLNVLAVTRLSDRTFADYGSPEEKLMQGFEKRHQLETPRVPAESRVIALQLLAAMPELAEKRSRLWVPVFLEAQNSNKNLPRVSISDASTSSHTLSPDIEDYEWTLRDRKAFLGLLSKFNNPAVLYRAKEIQAELFDLLANGSIDVRKLALQALLAWKDPVLTQYKEHFLDLVDDKTVNAKLGPMLSQESEESPIRTGHRMDVLRVILRLLFGQIIGRSGAYGSQEARRKAVLTVIFRLSEPEVLMFIEVALGKLNHVRMSNDESAENNIVNSDIMPLDQQYGFLRMMLSMFEVAQSGFAPYGQRVVDAILYCTVKAAHQINSEPELSQEMTASAMLRNIRRTGLQCLNALFKHCPDTEWEPYLPLVFRELIVPRLGTFAIETAQGISALLRIFATWAQNPSQVSFLNDYDTSLPSVLWQGMTVPSARLDVRLFILEHIATPLVDLANDEPLESNKAAMMLSAQTEGLLTQIARLLETTPTKEMLIAITSVVPKMVPFVHSPTAATQVVGLLIKLLREPGQKVPPHIKSGLLGAIDGLLRLEDVHVDIDTCNELYSLVASLYNYFKDASSRTVLGQLLRKLAKEDVALTDSIDLCEDLNAVSSTQLNDIDYDRRLAAFGAINELDAAYAGFKQWLPIVYNLIYFTRSAEDFSIRSNAVNSLKQISIRACSSTNPQLEQLASDVVLLAVKKGIKEDSELIRADFVSLLGLLVRHLHNNDEMRNMAVLLVDNDEEASFFSNVLHIQQHRRVRAIGRLVKAVSSGSISATNVSTIFLPLLENFVYTADPDESASGVKGQAVAAIGSLLQWTIWKDSRSLFRQYRQDLDSSTRAEKDAIRMLSIAADALVRATDEKSLQSQSDGQSVSHLAKSLPEADVVNRELRTNLIPRLAGFVHLKDDTQISLRIPAAVTAIKLIKLLPEEEIAQLSAPVLLDISQILRSRTQESRDIARNTLAEIMVSMGSSSMQYVIKELRTALTRGYQLHVLSYTMHTILVASAAHLQLGDLDYCLQDLIAVVMDDIFGVVGQEKENQDYISSMKEVKSSKSFDSIELLARSSGVSSLVKLVEPLQTLLTGTLTTKQVRHVDELLRRIGVGLSRNPAASSRDLLVFSYQLIQSFYKQKTKVEPRPLTNDEVNRQRFLIQLKSANKSTSGTSSPSLYKLPKFALDIVRSMLQKHDSLLTAENVHGFLPIIGDALIEAQEDVKISALRLLSVIVKLPMQELDQNASMYAMEAVKVVRNCLSTNEEAAQASLKLIASILRERRNASLRDSDMAYLLHRITPDLEEPDRQGVTFNFIRAVMARKFQLPEVYELVDKIGIMMVTNHARGARDVARGVYVHFLIEYEQHAKRWDKQLKFLMKNLEYEYPEGRQTVMEAVNILVSKKKGDQGQELIQRFFVPVALRMVNDDNAVCRELAGALLGQLFRKADNTQLSAMLEPLQVWIEQTENATLTTLSMQAYSVFLGSVESGAEAQIPHLRSCVIRVLQAPKEELEDSWEMQFHALQLLTKIVAEYPATVMTQKQSGLWASVRVLLSHSHPWIQSSALSLINHFFKDSVADGLDNIPLSCSQGLRFDGQALREILRSSTKLLRRNQGNVDLNTHIMQTLLFLGRCINVNGLTMPVRAQTDTEMREDGADGSDAAELSEGGSDPEASQKTKDIPAIQYLLDQAALVLRREPPKLTSTSIYPKQASLTLLTTLIAHLSSSSLSPRTLQSILLPLQHLTDPNIFTPRSADPAFPAAYQDLIQRAHAVMEALQKKIGDSEYVKTMTAVSRTVRERREGRRTKRRIEQVREPEKAARDKRRKHDREKSRKKEIGRVHMGRRKGI